MNNKNNLKDFSYNISHDLSGPLRIIKEFSKRLLDDLGDDLTEKQKLYSGLITDSVLKSEMLLKNIREYALVTDRARDFKQYGDIKSEIIDPVISKLKQDFSSFQDVTFEILGSDLKVNIDLEYLQLVLSHLIKNAVIFKKDLEDPIVIITYEAKDSETLFAIKDNGIGISEDNQELIFRLSKVLDPQQYPENRGSGLAMAKKIIEEVFEGKIWCESSPEGSTFYFTIKNLSL